ncbi:hypothetical protein CYMTET_42846 [Cymbomonas tetramitiformis]|uniref:AP-2 complex subunit alpha n=1 Tax=Cymbomonas tetramitiformis TaxID=36881 RepID=A0AAE0F140_9CHLO|nr:hypothetical protein CYMTET_42846 [Cymbomonas tetramitiformis]
MQVGSMRGLTVFISDVRGCQTKATERVRVDKELANIRIKFKAEKNLSAYDKKKYVWKLLYIYMLGYDVEFGHMEALSLISSPKYAEKQVGYIVTSVMINEGHEFLRLVINSIRNDLIGRNETYQCLALTCVANVGGKEFAEALAVDVQKLLMSSTLRPIVRKKAALCLLRLFRKNPEFIQDSWGSEQMCYLLDERDLGVLTAVMSLLVSLVALDPAPFSACLPKCVSIMSRIVANNSSEIPAEWTYYNIPSPWLQVKLMRVLQYFPPPEDAGLRRSLLEALGRVLLTTEVSKNVNKNNAMHAVLFEAITLVMHLDSEQELVSQCVNLLGKFISVREPNIRYLGLENMSRLSVLPEMVPVIQAHQVAPLSALPEMLPVIQAHQEKILASLQDTDISIRRRGLDLVFSMCDENNAKDLTSELLKYLETADFSIREELTLKMAILAERFAVDLKWYVDVILELVDKAGEFVSDEIWFRIVQVITNSEELHAYSASKVYTFLLEGSTQEPMIKVAAYLLGEFGRGIPIPPQQQFALLHESFATMGLSTRNIMLSAYAKMLMNCTPDDPEFRAKVHAVFKRYETNTDADTQQRVLEYLGLTSRPEAAMRGVLAEMPKFPERASILERAVKEKEAETTDASVQRVRSMNAEASQEVSPASATVPEIIVPVLPVAPIETPPPPTSPPQDLISGSPVAAAEPPVIEPIAPVQPSGSANVMDLLDGLIEPSAQAPAPAPAPTSAAAPSPDPFAGSAGMEDLLGGSGVASSAAAPAQVQPIADVQEWFHKLCMADNGVLYEDPNLQIGLKSSYQGFQGRVVLYLGNKAPATLSSLRLHVAPIPGLKVSINEHPGATLAPKQQIMVVIDVACSAPFMEPPQLHFGYSTDTQQAQQQLRLPIVLNKFLQPLPVTCVPPAPPAPYQPHLHSGSPRAASARRCLRGRLPQRQAPLVCTPPALERVLTELVGRGWLGHAQRNEFFERWRAIPGPPLKLQEIVQVSAALTAAGLPAVQALLNALRLNVVPQLDPNPRNMVTAATLCCEASMDGIVIVRMESDANNSAQYRVTVSTSNQVASSTLKDIILTHLKA